MFATVFVGAWLYRPALRARKPCRRTTRQKICMARRAPSPAASLIAVVDKKPIAKIDDRFYCPISDARPSRRSSGRQASFLTRHLSADQANNALAETLTSGIWTHDYPIWTSTAKSLGLPVNTNMPDRVFQPLKLYPQPVRMQSGGGGVEYLPVERRNQPQSSLSCSKQFRGS